MVQQQRKIEAVQGIEHQRYDRRLSSARSRMSPVFGSMWNQLLATSSKPTRNTGKTRLLWCGYQ